VWDPVHVLQFPGAFYARKSSKIWTLAHNFCLAFIAQFWDSSNCAMLRGNRGTMPSLVQHGSRLKLPRVTIFPYWKTQVPRSSKYATIQVHLGMIFRVAQPSELFSKTCKTCSLSYYMLSSHLWQFWAQFTMYNMHLTI